MKSRHLLVAVASILAAACGAVPDADTSDSNIEGAGEAEQARVTNQVFVVNARSDNKSIVVHAAEFDAGGEPTIKGKVSGGAGINETFTFSKLAIRGYVVVDSETKVLGSFALADTDEGNDVTIVCTGHSDPAEEIEDRCMRKLAAPAPPAQATITTEGKRFDITLGYGGLDTLTVHPRGAEQLKVEHFFAVGGTKPNAGVKHHLYGGTPAYLDVWEGGSKHGEMTFQVPDDARFIDASLLCWESGDDRSLACSLLSKDGKVRTDGDGKILRAECNGTAETRTTGGGSSANACATDECWSSSKSSCFALDAVIALADGDWKCTDPRGEHGEWTKQ